MSECYADRWENEDANPVAAAVATETNGKMGTLPDADPVAAEMNGEMGALPSAGIPPSKSDIPPIESPQ